MANVSFTVTRPPAINGAPRPSPANGRSSGSGYQRRAFDSDDEDDGPKVEAVSGFGPRGAVRYVAITRTASTRGLNSPKSPYDRSPRHATAKPTAPRGPLIIMPQA